MRSTSKKDEPHSALQILTAYLTENDVILGQEAIHKKQWKDVFAEKERHHMAAITAQPVRTEICLCDRSNGR